MNFRDIVNLVKENGGVSYSTTYGSLVGKNGYAVSVHKEREVILPLNRLNDNEVRNFFYENANLLAEDGKFLGIWVEDGNAYLDVSTKVKLKAEAIKMAKDNNQLAIFDLYKSETVYV
jgi:hypothetical protein